MASKLLRRSGVAVGLVVELLKWRADVMYHIGIGGHYEEVDVLKEEWPGVRFIGCEPHPETFRGLQGVYPGEIHEVAIGNTSGVVKLYSKKRHKDGSSLFHHFERDDENYRSFDVKMTTLDLLFPKIESGRILLWVDCEGSELDVFQGGEEFIKGVDVVNVEITAKPPGTGWCSPSNVHQWLIDHGFLRQWIHTQRTHQGQYDGIYVKPHLFRPEYCCCPCQCIKESER